MNPIEQRRHALQLLGRYRDIIDPDDVCQQAHLEFLVEGGGSNDKLTIFTALVAGRLKQRARRAFLREVSLDAPAGTEPDSPTIVDRLPAKQIDSFARTLTREVVGEAVSISRAMLANKPNCNENARQMERILRLLFLEGAESFAAAYEADRQCHSEKGMSRTVAYDLWLQVDGSLKVRLAGLRGTRPHGERDGRRK